MALVLLWVPDFAIFVMQGNQMGDSLRLCDFYIVEVSSAYTTREPFSAFTVEKAQDRDTNRWRLLHIPSLISLFSFSLVEKMFGASLISTLVQVFI